MNKMLVVAALTCLAGVARADFVEGFEPGFTGAGWVFSNQSNPLGTQPWFLTASAHTGTQALGVNYQSGAGVSTLSNWAVLPTQSLSNGDIFSFWSEAPFNNSFPDRLQVRLSTNGERKPTRA